MSPAPAITVGSVISGRFRVDEILGAGGMGIVVGATHLELGSKVAIKLLREDMAQAPTIVERFLREARVVVQLRTDHVCRVIDVGRFDNGAPFIVLEHLTGSDLAGVLKAGPLPATIAVEYVMQACIALAEAHGAGLVHRDLKPANLFVTKRFDGGPLIKVLDFGIAKALADTEAHLTQTVGAMGSHGYMSPEQIYSARDVDARADVWALGVTLYQLLAGRLPFPATNPTELAMQIANEPPRPIDVAPELTAVIARCLAKNPADRYPDVVELAVALVPFGGPSARQIATTVGLAANRPITLPRAAPGSGPREYTVPVAQSAATAATGLVPATVPTVPTVSTPTPTPAPRKRSVLFGVVLVVAIAGIAGAMAFAIRRQQASAPPPPNGSDVAVLVKHDAAPDAPAPHADAPLPSVVKPPPAPPDAAPDAAAQAPDTDDLGDVKAELSGMSGQLKAACAEMMTPEALAAVPPEALIVCYCVLEDRAHALATLAKIPASGRDGARQQCALLGMKL